MDRGKQQSQRGYVRTPTIVTIVALSAAAAVACTQAAMHTGTARGPILLDLGAVSGVVCAAGIVAVIAALKMRATFQRLLWVLLGVSILASGVGTFLFGYAEFTGSAPPATEILANAMFLVQYAVFPYLCIRVAMEFRNSVRVGRLAGAAAFVGIVLTAAAWIIFYWPGLQAGASFSAGAVTDLAFAMLDMVLLITPTIFLMLVLAAANGVQDQRAEWVRLGPWIVLAVGVVVATAADINWFWEWSLAIWQPGSLGDVGFVVSQVIFAIAALLALDVDVFTAAVPEEES